MNFKVKCTNSEIIYIIIQNTGVLSSNKIDFEINMLPLAKITNKINLSRHDSSDCRAVASNLEDPGSITHSGCI